SGLLSVQPETNQLPSKDHQHLFVGIVVDSSPTNSKTWNIRKSRAIELITSLQKGDKIIVLKARPGSPSVYGTALIGGQEKSGSNEIVSRVSVLNKELLSSVDVARACESIHDIFTSEGQGYKCLLVVLTNGKLRTDRVERTLRTASQIKALGGSTCLTYDPAVAKENLINAGKGNDIEILLESNPRLANWIQSKRPPITPEPKSEKTETEYVIFEPNLAPITTMLDNALTTIKSEADQPVTKVTEYIIKEVPVVKEPNVVLADITKETLPPKEEDTMVIKPQGDKKHFPVISLIVAGIMLLSMILIGKTLLQNHHKENNSNLDQTQEQPPGNLKAAIGDQDIDLGEIDLISELTMGNDPGCSIYIEDEQLSPQLGRIFQTKKGFKFQNLDSDLMYVNCQEVAPNKKFKFELPADIQLPNGTMLNLFTEAVKPEETGETDEE
ncbi:MAG: hypothetical protein ACYTEU_12140, partial [Planctomycetota bacterium]